MTQINQPTKTWKNPRPSIYNGPLADLRAVFASLEAFLARPSFYNGIELGDGTAPTKDAEGVTSKPPTVTVDSVSITEPSQAILDQLTVLDQRAAALETNPIPFVRITDVSIDTPMLAANAVTADKLAAVYLSVGKFIRSGNFSSGSAGWAIDGNGVAEFNDVIVRGTVVSPNFQTKQSGARVRMGEALTASDEIQFISAAGGIGSIRNPQVNGFGSSLRLSAGGIIDLFGVQGGGGSLKLTAPQGQIDIDGSTVNVNGAGVITTANVGAYAGYGYWATATFNKVYVGGHPTTAFASANCYIDSQDGQLMRSTSSRRYKTAIRPLTSGMNPMAAVAALRPVVWFSRLHGGDLGGPDDPNRLGVGLIAEEAAAVHERFATYDGDGVPNGVDWQAVNTAMLAEVQRLAREVELLRRGGTNVPGT